MHYQKNIFTVFICYSTIATIINTIIPTCKTEVIFCAKLLLSYFLADFCALVALSNLLNLIVSLSSEKFVLKSLLSNRLNLLSTVSDEKDSLKTLFSIPLLFFLPSWALELILTPLPPLLEA